MSWSAVEASRIHRIVWRAVPVLLALLLGGCASGSVGGLFSSSESDAPQNTVSSRVAFAKVIGAPTNVSEQLEQQLQSAAKQRDITVVSPGKGGGAQFTVRGYLAASQEANQSKIAYIWDITDEDGKRAHRISGEETVAASGSNPWGGVGREATQKIATKTVTDLAAWLPRQPAPRPVADRSQTTGSTARGEVQAYVPQVTGAPGDGEKSLTLAIKKQLFKGGIKVANTQDGAVHAVRGVVKLGEASGGKQDITIEWQVVDPDGRRLGTVSQKNSISAGSLDGAWGATADAAAAAATDGILKLLPKPQT